MVQTRKTRPFRDLIRGFRKGKRPHYGRCNACGRKTVFFEYGAFTLTDTPYRNGLPCLFCKSVARQRGLIAALCELFGMHCPTLARLPEYLEKHRRKVYNVAARGIVHHFLKSYSGYTCSEYFPDVDKGSLCNGTRCEDLQSLTFPEESFDIVISEDVLEHVRRPREAFQSIFRVLKSEGYHVFTVPIMGDETTKRVDTTTDEDVHLLPPFYHGDPLRSEGALAYHDFGADILGMADSCGFESAMIRHDTEDNRWMSGHVIVSRKKAEPE